MNEIIDLEHDPSDKIMGDLTIKFHNPSREEVTIKKWDEGKSREYILWVDEDGVAHANFGRVEQTPDGWVTATEHKE